jgi:hypothetical protein
MVYVLDVHSSRYEDIIASAMQCGEGKLRLLEGCCCAQCGSSRLQLTGSRVARKLHAIPVFTVLAIALGRCLDCGHRERVLPSDALPGKVTGVEVVFAVASAVLGGQRVGTVAQRYSVSRLTVRYWVLGLGARFFRLVHAVSSPGYPCRAEHAAERRAHRVRCVHDGGSPSRVDPWGAAAAGSTLDARQRAGRRRERARGLGRAAGRGAPGCGYRRRAVPSGCSSVPHPVSRHVD